MKKSLATIFLLLAVMFSVFLAGNVVTKADEEITKLDKPTGLVIGETEDSYYVKWNAVENADSYYIALLMGDKLLYEMPTNETMLEIGKSYVDTGLIPEGTYTLEVYAVNSLYSISSDPSTIEYTFSNQQTTTPANNGTVVVKKASFKKVYAKKKSAKKLKMTFKSIPKYANALNYKYEVKAFSSKSNAKKTKKALVTKYFTKAKGTINSKKLKNKKNLFVKLRYRVNVKYNPAPGKINIALYAREVVGPWSAIKKVKIKK